MLVVCWKVVCWVGILWKVVWYWLFAIDYLLLASKYWLFAIFDGLFLMGYF
jgi:hypothetical protein